MACLKGYVFCELGELCDDCYAAEIADDNAVIAEHVANCKADGFCYICQCL